MTEETEPRGELPDESDWTALTEEPAVDVSDDDGTPDIAMDSPRLAALPGEDDEEDPGDGRVAGAEGLPDDVRDGDIGIHEPEEN